MKQIAAHNDVNLLAMAVNIVTAQAGVRAMSADETADLLKSTYETLAGLSKMDVAAAALAAATEAPTAAAEAPTAAAEVAKPVPAVPIEESVRDDRIVCLEDGKELKMLKRYLRAAYNMTPEEYRAKWGLPDDYPMVAPGYAAEKSAYAKMVGLGTYNRYDRKRVAVAV